MVHLRSIRMRGFKTFARPTELLLEPGVTVIIGPNGSGKSNIADAVLWVLGEQSPASLRGRTMQDVVFSGADGKRMSSVAEVSLVFDNGSGMLPLDCSELEVTRRLSRETGSDYRLNGNACRLLDIQDMVGALGLGREMHSVISQGKVESFLNSSSEARRAMVEEAAGLGRFKKRKERAQAKLARTNQNLVRARDIEDEVRTAMRPLKQQVAAAERHAEATEEWAASRTRLLLRSLVEVEDAGNKLEEGLAGIESGLSEVGSRVAELRRRRILEEEGFSAALKERERLSSLFHRARADAEYIEGRTAALRQRVARLEGELDRATRRRDLAKSDASSLGARLRDALQDTVDEGRLARVAGWSEAVRLALTEAVAAYHETVKGEDDLKDTVFELEAARARALQDRESLSREREERGRVRSELTGLFADGQARVQQLRHEAEDLERKLAEAETAVSRTTATVKEAVAARDGARTRAQEASRREVALAEILAGLESREAVLRGVVERKEGLPAGARELLASSSDYRCLTELLAVLPGYERAVAAAFGPLIQAVAVPSSVDVEEVLRHVSGPVELVKEGTGQQNPAIEPPVGTRDLWEVISCPEKVEDVLRSLLPPTVIYEDGDRLDTRIARLNSRTEGRRPRIVSRSGELVDGDWHAARREEVGAESLLSAANELETVGRQQAQVRVECAQVRQTVEETAAEAAQAESFVRLQEDALRAAEHEFAGQRSERDLCQRRVEDSLAQMEELRARNEHELAVAEGLVAQLHAIEDVIATRETELEEARGAFRRLQSYLEGRRRTVARLEEKKSQAALVEIKLRERCRAVANERTRLADQKELADTEVARCDRRLGFLEKYAPIVGEMMAVAERLGGWSRTTAARLEGEVEGTRSETEGTARTMRDRGSAEIGLQREYDALTSKLTDARVEEARLNDRRSQLQGELAELRRRHLSPRNVSREEVAGADTHALAAAVDRAERRRDRIGPVNPLAEQEYNQLKERARFLAEQREDLEAAVGRLREVIAELDEHIHRTFDEVFQAAKTNFSAVIAVVFPGAKGTLSLTEAKAVLGEAPDGWDGAFEETFAESEGQPVAGVDLEVRFPNKAPRSLSLLSGGEKAMTAIAFLFALFLSRPCPFYILDEVEASLDDINIRRFLSLIHKYRDKTQFIIITHQRQTMEVADTLYGVALEGDGSSRILSRKMRMAEGA